MTTREDITAAENLGQGFRLSKDIRGRKHEAVWVLKPHPLGHELWLDVDRTLSRSQVCRSTEEILSTTEAWKRALYERGWR